MNGVIGEIRVFAGNFAPRTWAFCEGQLLAISSNTALFSILGTTYGGDGRTTFALPDLRGRMAIHAGRGPGLSTRKLGARGGAETNTLNILNLPQHSHLGSMNNFYVPFGVANAEGDSPKATGNGLAKATNDDDGTHTGDHMYINDTPTAEMHANTVNIAVTNSIQTSNTGGGQSYNLMSPFLSTYYVICMQGIYPSRS